MLEKGPDRSCSPWRIVHAGAGFLAGTVTRRAPHCSSLFWKECTPWKGPLLEQLLKTCSLWERIMLEMLMKDCFPVEWPHAGAGEQCENKRAAEMKCYEPTVNTQSLSTCTAWGGEEIVVMRELSWSGKKVVLVLVFLYFSISYSFINLQ